MEGLSPDGDRECRQQQGWLRGITSSHQEISHMRKTIKSLISAVPRRFSITMCFPHLKTVVKATHTFRPTSGRASAHTHANPEFRVDYFCLSKHLAVQPSPCCIQCFLIKNVAIPPPPPTPSLSLSLGHTHQQTFVVMNVATLVLPQHRQRLRVLVQLVQCLCWTRVPHQTGLPSQPQNTPAPHHYAHRVSADP